MVSQSQRPLVLVIEDDRRLVSALTMMIEDWGYECVAVAALAAARSALGQRRDEVVVVVADLSDGEHWGSDRTHEAFAGAVGREIPVIATSTHPGQARRNGFGTVLAKPYEPEDLRALLRQVTPRAAVARKAC